MSAPFHDQRLNAVRFARADPAQTLAAAALIVALADARDDSYPMRQTESVGWLTAGAGKRWCALLGGEDVLADALAAMADPEPTPYQRLMAR